MVTRNNKTGVALFSDASVSGTVQSVAETIFSRIVSEQYQPDTRLPAERNLANELNVARNTVREALDLLEDRKIIERKPSSGSYVTYEPSQSPKTIDDSRPALNISVSGATSPLDLQVVRGIVEPEMIRLAIVNMPPLEVEILGAILSRMEDIHTDATKFVGLEEEFFRHLAKATGNPLLTAFYELILDARQQNFRVAQQKRYLTPERIEEYQRRYNSLFNAIALRDIESAVEYCQLHLIDEQKLLLQEE